MTFSELASKVASLDQSRAALEKSYSDWGVWLGIATFIVVVGLVIEYGPDASKLFKRPVDWMHVAEMCGALLVVGGICFEGLAEYKAGEIATALDENGRHIERLLFSEAASADEKIARENQLARAANSTAARATDEARGLEVKAASLRRAADEAGLKLEQTRAAMAWRELTPAQSAAITAALSAEPMTVSLSAVASNEEAEEFEDQLREAFARAGLDVRNGGSVLVAGGIRTPLKVTGRRAEVDLMTRALSLGGVTAESELADHDLEIMVGPKPRPKIIAP